MALKKSVLLQNGFSVEDAYIRIDTVNGYKGNIEISVNSYKDENSFTDGLGYLEQKFYNFVPDVSDEAHNFIKQGYEYLKSLDEYENALDV